MACLLLTIVKSESDLRKFWIFIRNVITLTSFQGFEKRGQPKALSDALVVLLGNA